MTNIILKNTLHPCFTAVVTIEYTVTVGAVDFADGHDLGDSDASARRVSVSG